MANMNDLLKEAQKSKKDEFYTQMVDIEKELKYYRNHFKGKIVFCNCDDPFESNFFKYFVLNFNKLGLKKLIATSYASSPYVGQELSMFEDQGKEYKINNKKAYKVVVSEININNKDGGETLEDIKEIIRHRIRYLKEDGD
ncbi:adenine-specific methyltransferase EcoRI family protein, partial [Phascolarctobacterium faecium]